MTFTLVFVHEDGYAVSFSNRQSGFSLPHYYTPLTLTIYLLDVDHSVLLDSIRYVRVIRSYVSQEEID